MNRLMNIALAICLSLSLSPPAAARDTPTDTKTNAIMLIDCDEGFGSGFVIAKNVVATARHVSTMHNCVVGGTHRKIRTYLSDDKNDFSLMTTDTSGFGIMPFSCEPYRKGHKYFSFGFGDGKPMLQRLTATKDHDRNLRVLLGTIISGQSGGPVVDIDGVAHGINNASNYAWGFSLSAELKDTPLCRR